MKSHLGPTDPSWRQSCHSLKTRLELSGMLTLCPSVCLTSTHTRGPVTSSTHVSDKLALSQHTWHAQWRHQHMCSTLHTSQLISLDWTHMAANHLLTNRGILCCNIISAYLCCLYQWSISVSIIRSTGEINYRVYYIIILHLRLIDTFFLRTVLKIIFTYFKMKETMFEYDPGPL